MLTGLAALLAGGAALLQLPQLAPYLSLARETARASWVAARCCCWSGSGCAAAASGAGAIAMP